MAMNEFPNVTSVGTPTAGILSFMYEFNLPNGWWVSLSNSRTLSADSTLYEGIGIPPEIVILNSKNDLVANRDPMLVKALEILK